MNPDMLGLAVVCSGRRSRVAPGLAVLLGMAVALLVGGGSAAAETTGAAEQAVEPPPIQAIPLSDISKRAAATTSTLDAMLPAESAVDDFNQLKTTVGALRDEVEAKVARIEATLE